MGYITPTQNGTVMFAICHDGKQRKVTTQSRGANNDGDPRWHGVVQVGKTMFGGVLEWNSIGYDFRIC